MLISVMRMIISVMRMLISMMACLVGDTSGGSDELRGIRLTLLLHPAATRLDAVVQVYTMS